MDQIKEKIEIRVVGEESVDEQVKIYMESFNSQKSVQEVRQYWLDKHYKNPVKNSTVVAALIDDNIVGLNAFMPMVYSWQGRYIHVVQSCESGVHPDHRRKGIFYRIMKYAMNYFTSSQEYDMMIGFPNYENSYEGFLKLGWKKICNMNNSLLFNNGRNSLMALLKTDGFNCLGKLIELQKIPVKLRAGILKNYKVECVASAPDLDGAWELHTEGINLRVTGDFLGWKNRYNHHEQYIVRKDEKRIAYFICKDSELNGVGYCELIHNIILSDNKKDGINAFAAYLNELGKREKYNFMRAWEKEGEKDRLLYRSMAFIRTSRHQNPFIGYVLTEKNFKKETLLNHALWKISFLDLD